MNNLMRELTNLENILKGLVLGFILLRCLLIFSNARSNSQPFSEALERCKKVVYAGVIAIFTPEYISIISGVGFFAGTTSMDTLGKQILNLLKVVSEVFTSLAVAMTVMNVIKELLAFKIASDDHKIFHKEQIRKILLVGIATVCSSAILTVIFSYFV